MIAKSFAWLLGNGDPLKATGHIAILGASLVILSAGILGYTALFDLFKSIGLFHPSLAAFFPLLFDFAEITAAVIVLNAKLQGEDDKLAWRAVLIFTGLGIIANIAHAVFAWYSATINTGQAILAILFTALFPLSVALVTHLLKSVITRDIQRNETIKTLSTLLNDIAQKRNDCVTLDEQIQYQQEQFAGKQTEYEANFRAKQGEIERLNQEIEQLQLSIERLRTEHQQAKRGEFTASKAERQAYQLDGMLAAGMTLTAACELTGISPNTARKRLESLDGNALSRG